MSRSKKKKVEQFNVTVSTDHYKMRKEVLNRYNKNPREHGFFKDKVSSKDLEERMIEREYYGLHKDEDVEREVPDIQDVFYYSANDIKLKNEVGCPDLKILKINNELKWCCLGEADKGRYGKKYIVLGNIDERHNIRETCSSCIRKTAEKKDKERRKYAIKSIQKQLEKVFMDFGKEKIKLPVALCFNIDGFGYGNVSDENYDLICPIENNQKVNAYTHCSKDPCPYLRVILPTFKLDQIEGWKKVRKEAKDIMKPQLTYEEPIDEIKERGFVESEQKINEDEK